MLVYDDDTAATDNDEGEYIDDGCGDDYGGDGGVDGDAYVDGDDAGCLCVRW